MFERIDNLEEWEGPLVRGLSNEDYHTKVDAFSSSDIKYMRQSPKHFEAFVLNKDKLPIRENKVDAAMSIGTAAHGLYLENSSEDYAVEQEYVLAKDHPEKLSQVKQKALWKEENAGKAWLSPKGEQRVLEMMKVIKSNKRAVDILDGAWIENSYLYRDPGTGLKCKFRPDIFHRNHIVDYKTCESSLPHDCLRAIERYGYHISAAHYLVGAHRIFGVMPEKYTFVFQETKAPYSICFVELSEGDKSESIRLRATLMARIKHFMNDDKWPDYSEKTILTNLRSYAFELEEL